MCSTFASQIFQTKIQIFAETCRAKLRIVDHFKQALLSTLTLKLCGVLFWTNYVMLSSYKEQHAYPGTSCNGVTPDMLPDSRYIYFLQGCREIIQCIGLNVVQYLVQYLSLHTFAPVYVNILNIYTTVQKFGEWEMS